MEPRELPLSAAALTRTALVAFAFVALALLLWAARTVLFVLFLGLLIGVFLSFFTDRLTRMDLRRTPALLLVLLVGLVLLAGFALLLWPTIRAELTTVSREVPEATEAAVGWLESQYREILGRMGEPAADLQEEVRGRLSDQVDRLLLGALPVINTVVGAMVAGLIAIVVGVYTAADPQLYRKGLERLVPPRHRARVRLTLDETGRTLRRWLLGTLINMLLVALLTGLGLWIIGVPAAFALAAIAAFFEFIPIFGPIIAAVPAVVLAFTVSPATALWVLVLYTLIQQVESYVFTPLVMRGAVRLPPALTVLVQALMLVVFGFLGLLLAVPILAALMDAVRILYVEPMEERSAS